MTETVISILAPKTNPLRPLNTPWPTLQKPPDFIEPSLSPAQCGSPHRARGEGQSDSVASGCASE